MCTKLFKGKNIIVHRKMMCGNEMTFEMCICMIQHLLHEAINENLYHMENNYLLLRKLLN